MSERSIIVKVEDYEAMQAELAGLRARFLPCTPEDFATTSALVASLRARIDELRACRGCVSCGAEHMCPR